MATQKIPDNEFRLALTMAGAVSAGCYTAGVMDYLFEILELWEKAKGNTEGLFDDYSKDGDISYENLSVYIPQHKVIIEAMGGASAGAMTTTMSAIYALNGNFSPIRKPVEENSKTGNMLYDNWVVMDDDRHHYPKNTFSELWDTKDLTPGSLKSFLNSQFVDNIAGEAFKYKGNIAKKTKELPGYISKELQLILSHTLLRGIPLKVDFQTPIAKTGRKSIIPNHTTYEHYVVSQFHLNNGQKPAEGYLFLNPYHSPYKDTMKVATMATGAFPLGLAYRNFEQTHFSDKYWKNAILRVVRGTFGSSEETASMSIEDLPKAFSSYTVDGGAINNEPYREVLSILEDKYGPSRGCEFPAFGVVMIDPFPDQIDKDAVYEEPQDLLDIVPSIIRTLTDQARVKRREMLDADEKGAFKSIIFPRKWKKNGKRLIPDNYPLACAAVEAFGGFLDINFRKHDFFLGRHNARNFFRYFFSMPYLLDEQGKVTSCHPIHKGWTPKMVKVFKVVKDGVIYLPIIPDLSLLFESDQLRRKNQYKYAMDKPKIRPDVLFGLQYQIKKRLLRIFEVVEKRKSKKKPSPLYRNAELWKASYYKQNWIDKLKGIFSRTIASVVFFFAKQVAAEKLTNFIIKTIITDLDKNELLETFVEPEKQAIRDSKKEN